MAAQVVRGRLWKRLTECATFFRTLLSGRSGLAILWRPQGKSQIRDSSILSPLWRPPFDAWFAPFWLSIPTRARCQLEIPLQVAEIVESLVLAGYPTFEIASPCDTSTTESWVPKRLQLEWQPVPWLLQPTNIELRLGKAVMNGRTALTETFRDLPSRVCLPAFPTC